MRMRENFEENFKLLKKGLNNSIILLDPKNELVAVGFSGRRKKPEFYHIFKNVKHRDTFVENFLQKIEKKVKEKEERKEKVLNKYNDLKEGDVFYTSWGYEQTNVEFFQVVKIISNKTIEVREISQKRYENNHDMSGNTTPLKDEFLGQVVRSRLSSYGNFRDPNGHNLYLYDGNAKSYSNYH